MFDLFPQVARCLACGKEFVCTKEGGYKRAVQGQSTPIRQILGAVKSRIVFKFGQWIHILMKH
jgi:hypothetical protein